MGLSDDDIDRIASATSKKMLALAPSCMSTEEHYRQHQEIGELLGLIKSGTNFFVKGVAGMFAIGVLVILSTGIKSGYWH